MELLRILAMLLVLALHANYKSLGNVMPGDIQADPVGNVMRLLFEGISIMCVNLFVLISGWFAIRPSKKGACKFLFQCLYFSAGITAICLLTGYASGSPIQIIKSILSVDYWFIPAYIGLYILAPVINAFIDRCDRRQLLTVTLSYLTLQWFYGYLFLTDMFCNGYSILSFIGLYLIGRYARLYMNGISQTTLITALTVSLLLNCAIGASGTEGTERFLSYTSPLIICQALATLILFSRLRIGVNTVINTVAASSFAVYLFHCHPLLFGHYKTICVALYSEYSSAAYPAMITLFILVVFAISIVLDSPRIFLWKHISRAIENRREATFDTTTT